MGKGDGHPCHSPVPHSVSFAQQSGTRDLQSAPRPPLRLLESVYTLGRREQLRKKALSTKASDNGCY